MKLSLCCSVFQSGARRMDWTVVRVEDLLEEAQKEGGGDVAEAEVRMGFEVRGGCEEKNYINISIFSMRFESLFYGRNCQTENEHLISLCLHLVPTRCFPILSVLETVSHSSIPSVELEKTQGFIV